MLSPEYLDRLPEAVMKQIEDAELAIIRDMARRIAKAGEVTATAEWQLLKLQEMGAEQSFILGELRRTFELSDKELQELFIRAAEKTLETDDEIYRTAGYDPPPLKESPYAETVIRSGYIRTRGTFYNLTETTARTAGKQFERILDEGHLRLTSGAFSYQEVIRWGVKKLAEEGVKAIEYPSGHTDSLDTAYRRATLTGLNQAGLKLQEERMNEMGVEYVETTAHAGARPSHTVWQGRIFKLRGSDEKYDNFYTATGYGTGEGLGGWNCRHGFYPFFPGISEPANSEEYLRQLNEKSVKYNGEKMSMYEATQKQRYMERQIRRWKREYTGMEAAGQDTRESAMKLKAWREREYDFLRQTGLDRQKDREMVSGFGRSQAAKATWTAERYYQEWSKSVGINNSIKTLANYYDVKYNNSPRYRLLQGYVRAVEKRDISPLIGFEEYERVSNEINNKIVGVTAKNGVTIESFATHFIDRVIGQTSTPHKGMRCGVPVDDVLDTLLNPQKLKDVRKLDDGDIRQTLFGKNAVVTMSIRDKLLIQTNPRGD